MSIELEHETLVAFSDARTSFRDGRRKSLATLHRWRLRGIRGVRLETLLIGGIRYTSLEAIDRFIQAQNLNDAPAAPVISASQRKQQAEAARTVLKKMGVADTVSRANPNSTEPSNVPPAMPRH